MRATGLFRKLYEHRNPGSVLVIDDCDAVFGDETTLNLLKAALELGGERTISWGSEKIFVDDEGDQLPRSFTFEGSVIFLTNLSIRELISSGNKLSPHLAALESRSLVLDMRIKTPQDFLTVIDIKLAEGLLSSKGFSADEEAEIMDFVRNNASKFTELSLRLVEKVGSLYRANPTKWQKLARSVCFK